MVPVNVPGVAPEGPDTDATRVLGVIPALGDTASQGAPEMETENCVGCMFETKRFWAGGFGPPI